MANPLKTRNFNSFPFCALLLKTDKEEGEEYLFYSYPKGERAKKFTALKGVFLSCNSIAKSVAGETADIFAFTLGRGGPKSFINSVEVQPLFDPSKGEESMFKATFADFQRENLLLTIVLPALFADSICNMAVNEALESIQTLLEPGFKPEENTRLDSIFEGLFY